MTLISNLDVRNELRQEVLKVLGEIWQRRQQGAGMPIEKKDDGSHLTELDKRICRLLKSKILKYHSNEAVGYFSEERPAEFLFPLYVADPIDGTREFINQRPEFVLSLAYLNSCEVDDPKSAGWILNPLTGFELTSEALALSGVVSDLKLGLVSRSEWEQGLYQDIEDDTIKISPLGSIAYKLGLLAAGACDFVISRKPKNLWDIAGGSIILQRQGFRFYEQGREVSELVLRKYEAPLIWCRPRHLEQLARKFQF